jgi:hypothetical protein
VSARAGLALAEETVLGERLFIVVAPGGQVRVCIRFNISIDRLVGVNNIKTQRR